MLPRSLILPLSRAPLHLSAIGKGFRRNQEKECTEEDTEEEDGDSEECDKAKEKTKEQKAEEEKQEQEKKKDETERQESSPASEIQSPPLPYLSVLSGADPGLGPQLLEAAAEGKNWSPPTMSPSFPPPTLWPHKPLTLQFDLSSHLHPSH